MVLKGTYMPHTLPLIRHPAKYVPLTALATGNPEGSAIPISPDNPSPALINLSLQSELWSRMRKLRPAWRSWSIVRTPVKSCLSLPMDHSCLSASLLV
jgi:hypothetical protein